MARPLGATRGWWADHPGTERGSEWPFGSRDREKGTHRCHEASLGTEPRQKHTQAPENWAALLGPAHQCLPCEEAARSVVSQLRLHTLQL